ncbi:MAG: lipid II flippase MurJ, partial [Thermodesulfobacteriota bacterium]
MDEKRRVTRATGVIGSATLLSRIFGYARDMVLAAFLGAGMASDAFFVAFRIPNLLRRLFAEGSLTIAFVPVFLDQLQNRGREEAFAMARSALRLLSVILVAVTLLGIVFSPEIVYVMGFGFADAPEKFNLTVTLTRIMFPYVFFV